MSGSYKQCLRCDKRALSIASRCPGCGAEFPTQELPEEGGVAELGRFFTPGGVAAALALVAVVTVAQPGGTSHPPEEQSGMAAEAVAADTVLTGAGGDTLLVADTIVVVAPRPVAARDSVDASARLLVARNWTHVRKSRSRRAPLEAILTPGDTVTADSLGSGWYRVALEGEVMGYAHQSTLVASREAGGR